MYSKGLIINTFRISSYLFIYDNRFKIKFFKQYKHIDWIRLKKDLNKFGKSLELLLSMILLQKEKIRLVDTMKLFFIDVEWNVLNMKIPKRSKYQNSYIILLREPRKKKIKVPIFRMHFGVMNDEITFVYK